MRERRELILFAVVAALCVLLSYSKFDSGYVVARMPAASTMESRAVDRPAEINLLGLSDKPGSERGRGSFAPPRELLPLDPLVLPDPPMPALDLRRPAVSPGFADRSRYRVSAQSFGHLVLGGAEGADDESGSSGFDDDASSFDPAGELASAAEDDERAAQLFDWVVRMGSSRRVYGRIVHDDPHGLRMPLSAPLHFQQVTVRNGRPLGRSFDIPTAEVVEFGLADTFENRYFLNSRRLGTGGGAVAARSKLAQEMLAASATNERALPFAVAEARLAQAGAPNDPDAARLLATVLREAGDLEGELAVYAELEARGVSDAVLLADHAALLRELALPTRALELVSAALLVSNSAAELHLINGLLAADVGDHEAAVAAFRKADQGTFRPLLRERKKRDLALALGASLIAVGKPGEARREADQLLLANDQDASALHLRGACFAAENKLDEAAEALGRATALQPGDSSHLAAAAVIAWLRGDGDGALRLTERAREVQPWMSLPAMLTAGVVNEDGGQGSRARELYGEALLLSPDDPEALYRLGRLQRTSGDAETAHTTLRTALRRGGADALLLMELGGASLVAGELVGASGYLREALRMAPGDALVLWLLGLTHLGEGDLLGASDRLREAAAAGAPGARSALGVALHRLGDAAAAVDQFDEVERAFAGEADHPQAVFARNQAQALRDNLSKRQWLDTFGRSQLQRGWIERQWEGSPRVLLVPEGVAVAGRMEKPRTDERPGISRSVEGAKFVGAEAGLATGAPGDSRFGLSLTHRQIKGVLGQLPKGRLDIWVDPQGEVRLSALDNFETVLLDGVSAGVRVPAGTRVLLGIERVDLVNGVFAFRVDGRPVGSPVTVKSMRDLSRNTIDLDVYGEAPPGRNVDVVIDLVRIVQMP